MAQTIIVDTTPSGFRQPTIYYSQGDIGRTFNIDLRSRFGDNLPASPTITIQATKPSGLGFSVAATSISNSVATFTVTDTMTNEAGRFPAEIKVVKDSVTLFTANFYIECEVSAHPEGTTDGDLDSILPKFMSVTTTTLPAGSSATYTYDPATNTATFGIPQGAKGDDGTLSSNVIAAAYDATATYDVGDFSFYNGSLYRCTTAITTAEAWTVGHWTVVNVTDEITDLKDDYLQIVPNKANYTFTPTSGSLIDTTNATTATNVGFEYADVSVTERDVLYLSGYATSAVKYKPAFWSASALVEAIDVTPSGGYYSNVRVVVPIGATRLLINGRPSASQDIDIKKEVLTADSQNFLDDYKARTKHKYGVSLGADGTCKIFCSNYGTHEVLRVLIDRKAVNDLPDIHSILVYTDGTETAVPLDDVPIADTTRLRFIVNGTTDFLSPCILYAQNNVNGDFNDFTSGKLTGGWHGYNGETASGTPTARNIDYDVICDGVPLSSGSSTRCNALEIHITNRLQASNTEVSDGTGREVAEFKYRLVFDGFKIKVHASIKALEPIEIQLLYGISCRHVYNSIPIYFVGSRTNRGDQYPNVTSNSGDKYATGIEQIDTDIFKMGIEPTIDLGSMYANDRSFSILIDNGKSYMVLINDNGYRDNRLVLDTDEMAFYEGYYSAYKE